MKPKIKTSKQPAAIDKVFTRVKSITEGPNQGPNNKQDQAQAQHTYNINVDLSVTVGPNLYAYRVDNTKYRLLNEAN